MRYNGDEIKSICGLKKWTKQKERERAKIKKNKYKYMKKKKEKHYVMAWFFFRI